MTRQLQKRLAAASLALSLAFAGCSMIAKMRLEGTWESDATPKRTLVLRDDDTYLQRFSGKTLGFVSEVLGPETGRWHVAGNTLVLVRQESSGAEVTKRIPFESLSQDSVLLGGETWHRIEKRAQ
jgi:hypothetical protein